MRKISLDSARPGMVLAKAIVGGKGQILLNAGAEIKPQYLTYLKKLGISQLYIYDSRIEDIEVNDIVSDETRREASFLVTDIIGEAKKGTDKKKGINLRDKELLQTVTKIMDELLENKEMIAQLQDIRTVNDYIFSHSVNCCVLSTMIAVKMEYSKEVIKKVGTGALLHDLGMAAVPDHILNKPGELTEEEYDTIKRHPVYGYEMFKKTPSYSALAGAMILQHHERWKGQGYPQGLKEDKISPLVQAVSIADVYDALTSDRPYRKAYQPHEAIEMLMSWGDTYYDLNTLNLFLSSVAAYPVGTHVFLSNGESGLVIANNPGLTLRPVVRILYKGEDLAPHPDPYDLDLSKSIDLTVVKVLE